MYDKMKGHSLKLVQIHGVLVKKKIIANLINTVWRRPWEVLDDSAKHRVVGHVVLVPQRPRRRLNADVELLSKVSPLRQLRPQIPHSSIVERQHYRRPRLRVHLNCVSAHCIKQIVPAPLLRAPPPRFNSI